MHVRACGQRLCVWRKHYMRESDGGCPRLSANGGRASVRAVHAGVCACMHACAWQGRDVRRPPGTGMRCPGHDKSPPTPPTPPHLPHRKKNRDLIVRLGQLLHLAKGSIVSTGWMSTVTIISILPETSDGPIRNSVKPCSKSLRPGIRISSARLTLGTRAHRVAFKRSARSQKIVPSKKKNLGAGWRQGLRWYERPGHERTQAVALKEWWGC